jgi:hypothetical protein
MKRLLLLLLSVLSITRISAHNGELLSINDVKIDGHCNHIVFDFEIENVNKILLQDVKIELSAGDVVLDTKFYDKFPTDKYTNTEFVVSTEAIQNIDPRKLQINVTEIFGLKKDWGGWHGVDPATANYNDIGDFEIFADAPWRMDIYDEANEKLPIPLLIMARFGKDVLTTINQLNLEFVDIYLKKSTESDFGDALDFSHLNETEFQSMITSRSPDSLQIGLQSFDLSLIENDSEHTFAFNELENVNQGYRFTKIKSEFWFFSMMLSPELLADFTDSDYLDIKVVFTIRSNGGSINKRHSYLRVFRSASSVPKLAGYYRGDTHVHTIYSQSLLEFGSPLAATKEAAKSIGIDWVIVTDHTSDFDNWRDLNVEKAWTRLGTEVDALNAADTSVVFIRGQEVSLLNKQDELVHFLAYPGYETPTNLPYLGDGGGDLQFTNVSSTDAYDRLEIVDGFAYAAHPFATEDEVPLVGGLWNVGHPDFPANGAQFEVGGSILCNKVNAPSDVFSAEEGMIVQDKLKGAQIWGDRYSMVAAADPYDPYNIKEDPNGGQFAETPEGDLNYLNRYRQGEQVVKFVNLKALQLKNANPELENFKFFFSAGTDAHGSFNYSNTSIFGTFLDDNNDPVKNLSFGNISCVAYCPNGIGTQGQNALKAMYDGNFCVSDGPILINGISVNGENESELMMGMDAEVDSADLADVFVNLQYTSTPEFGAANYLKVFVGTNEGEFNFTLTDIADYNGQIAMSLSDILDESGANLTMNAYIYVRAELQTQAEYGANSPRILEEERFHSFTNPVWLKVNKEDIVSSVNDELERLIQIYPNPADKIVNITTTIPLEQVSIFDASGKLVIQTKARNKSVDVSKLPAGSYTIEVKMNDTRLAKTLIIF